MGADFVAVKNYSTPSILVAIGQRYHVIVEADPQGPNGGEDAGSAQSKLVALILLHKVKMATI